MGSAFGQKGLDSPRLLAELLMAHVLGCERLRLYMEADRPASDEERARLRMLVGRALKHEPVQYLVAEAWFFSMPLYVDSRVLIPRPSTETIAECVVQSARGLDGVVRIADVCTGSGCLAVAMAKHIPGATVVASDVSKDALEVARMNAERHGVTDRIQFGFGDLLAPLECEAGFDFLVANPPYIPDHEWREVEPNVRDHEPELALRGGVDGLELIRPIIREAPSKVRPGGVLCVEHAASHAEDILAFANDMGEWCDAEILEDFEGLPRVLRAVRA